MTYFYDPANVLLSLVGLAVLAIKCWALVDCLTRSGPAFPAAGKLTKGAWLAILVLALLLGSGVFGLFGIVGLVAAIVYLADVRPAVRTISSGGPWS